MIKLRQLILEGIDIITPRDIYDFYFIWRLRSDHPSMISDENVRPIIHNHVRNLKHKYLRLFKLLISNQLQKYFRQKRVDADFDSNRISDQESASVLWDQMQKTYRSDMKRRNDVWVLAAQYLTKLENAGSIDDMALYINQLNNCVHNTNTEMLGKAANGMELVQAFNTVHKVDPRFWRSKVSSDIRGLDVGNI